jgi:uncharacterized repeat protein (TIGR03806 family)
LLLVVSGCADRARIDLPQAPVKPFERLMQYGLFAGDAAAQMPATGVIPYDLNSALFSDYAAKYRFIKLPPGTRASYREDDVFEFPVGTVIAKTFAYFHDARDPSHGRRLIETRILKHDPDGWVGLPYIWNAAQTDAVLDVAGDTVDVTWIHTDGRSRTNNYMIPNANQCKGCHKAGESVLPIGPKARHLNRDFSYDDGTENQLDHWTRAGALAGAPTPAVAPRLAVWDDPRTGTLDARARAWLEINCAHCHNPVGPARNSGLDLLASQQNPTAFGMLKPPVAAGLGSGGLQYDIVPGKPEQSILAYRIGSTHPGVMMPELGKRLVHEEGVALIRAWIAAMARDDGQPKRVSALPGRRAVTNPASSQDTWSPQIFTVPARKANVGRHHPIASSGSPCLGLMKSAATPAMIAQAIR